MPHSAWSLHAQLTQDTSTSATLPCAVLLSRTRTTRGCCWCRAERCRGDHRLAEVEQAQLMTEVARVARALKDHPQMLDKSISRRLQCSAATSRSCHLRAGKSDAAWRARSGGAVPRLSMTPKSAEFHQRSQPQRRGRVQALAFTRCRIRRFAPQRLVTGSASRATVCRRARRRLFARASLREYV